MKFAGKTLVLAMGMALSQWGLASGQAADQFDPEAASAIEQKQLVKANKFMVAAANPKAVEAGYKVLQKGGTVMDAYVAVQTVLGLVEPQSSGLGGGAFAVYYDATTQQLTTFDGRETAPQDVTPELFQNADGSTMKFYDAVIGGRSVGTPGTVALMQKLHDEKGTLAWESLFEPAIELAENGFVVSPRLSSAIAATQDSLSKYPATKAYFMDVSGQPLATGTVLKNRPYAQTLRLIAQQGADGFYHSHIAQDIVDTVRSAADNPGRLGLNDFASYRVKERPAVCMPYEQFEVCGMGPPSSGALTVGQILGITSQFDLKSMGPDSAQAWQIIGDASRLAFADRGRYMADTDFVPMPEGLLDAAYLAERAKLIQPGKALTEATAGQPRWEKRLALADDQSIEFPSTSHISIVDSQGNALSVTTTIENGFGSRLMSNGFLLNNELTDFSFASYKDGMPIANRIEPGKRPRSSMAPTIVMKNDQPYMVVGSPGGSRIIGYVAKTLIAHTQWGMDVQSAISLPNMLNRFGTFDVEKGSAAEHLVPALEDMGVKVSVRDLNSGLQGIVMENGTLLGGADPRREGTVMGD
ncbi:gamma-glutamyltransferase [Marinomonas epiphytica]